MTPMMTIGLIAYKNLMADEDPFLGSGILKFDFQDFAVVAVLAL